MILVGSAAGCGEPSGVPGTAAPDATPRHSGLEEQQHGQRQIALAARDAMAARLAAELMEALGSSGPAGAVHVCQQLAPQVARDTGERFGVTAGRTSFRLRNSKNTPPEWARPLVDARAGEPRFVPLPNGGLGAVLPIRLRAECLLCHGPQDQILPEIREALAAHYPEDQATGFDVDELRGWFWISVPPGASLPPAGRSKASEEATPGRGDES